VILANGSLPVELPFLPFGGNVISSTEALSLDEAAEEAGRRRRRLYRPRTRHRLPQAGLAR
jgi:predicted transcriptional regulator